MISTSVFILIRYMTFFVLGLIAVSPALQDNGCLLIIYIILISFDFIFQIFDRYIAAKNYKKDKENIQKLINDISNVNNNKQD